MKKFQKYFIIFFKMQMKLNFYWRIYFDQFLVETNQVKSLSLATAIKLDEMKRMDQRVFRKKKHLHALKIENIALKLRLHLNLVAMYFAVRFFTNYEPHKLSIFQKIFFCVQLFLRAIYHPFLTNSGDALIHYEEIAQIHAESYS